MSGASDAALPNSRVCERARPQRILFELRGARGASTDVSQSTRRLGKKLAHSGHLNKEAIWIFKKGFYVLSKGRSNVSVDDSMIE